MKEKQLYEINFWGKQNYALLLPYEADEIRDYISDNNNKIFSIRFIDNTVCSVASVEKITDARKYSLSEIIEKLNNFLPKKIEALEIKNGKVFNTRQGMLSLNKIPDHKALYSYLFGNKLYVMTKTVRFKAKVNADVEAEIEVPENYNVCEYSDFIKQNKENLIINNFNYTLSDVILNDDVIIN